MMYRHCNKLGQTLSVSGLAVVLRGFNLDSAKNLGVVFSTQIDIIHKRKSNTRDQGRAHSPSPKNAAKDHRVASVINGLDLKCPVLSPLRSHFQRSICPGDFSLSHPQIPHFSFTARNTMYDQKGLNGYLLVHQAAFHERQYLSWRGCGDRQRWATTVTAGIWSPQAARLAARRPVPKVGQAGRPIVWVRPRKAFAVMMNIIQF
jgi:hypothetical protein